MEQDFLEWWNREGYENIVTEYSKVNFGYDDNSVNQPLFDFIKDLAFVTWKEASSSLRVAMVNALMGHPDGHV